MKVALLNTMTPYVRGGAEILVDDLAAQLRLHGHDADIFRLPFPASIEGSLVHNIAASRMLRFDKYERVLAFKFPAYCVPHPAKVLWVFHQFRQIYELWGTDFGLHTMPKAERIREIVRNADQKDILQSRHIYTIAQEVSNRLKHYNDISSEVIYPPLKNSENYYNSKTGDYLFYPSRITELKRQLLAVEAMRFVKSDIKLVIAGISEEPKYINTIYKKIRKYGLKKKMIIYNQWISDDYKMKLMAESLGCIFVPYKEDYGFITLESFYSSKPVITCNDSGGSTEFVEDGHTGYITEATPQALATAMDKLYEDRKKAEQMGVAARKEILSRNITWPETIRRLLL